jgi:hypothetical protein
MHDFSFSLAYPPDVNQHGARANLQNAVLVCEIGFLLHPQDVS